MSLSRCRCFFRRLHSVHRLPSRCSSIRCFSLPQSLRSHVPGSIYPDALYGSMSDTYHATNIGVLCNDAEMLRFYLRISMYHHTHDQLCTEFEAIGHPKRSCNVDISSGKSGWTIHIWYFVHLGYQCRLCHRPLVDACCVCHMWDYSSVVAHRDGGFWFRQ